MMMNFVEFILWDVEYFTSDDIVAADDSSQSSTEALVFKI